MAGRKGQPPLAPGTGPRTDNHSQLALLASIVDSSDDAIVSSNLEGVVTSWNQAAKRLYGYSAEEIVGTPFSTLILKAMKSGADFSVQNRSIWPDGTVRWLGGQGRVLLGEHGEPLRAVGISLDVTERRTLEEQFQQAQKMEAVGQLAGGVAHDFNNLLTAILGFSKFVMDSFEANDRRCSDRQEGINAGERATALTRQLLAFSRKQVLQPVTIDLNALVVGVRQMLVVDDEPSIRQLARRFLEEGSYQVREVDVISVLIVDDDARIRAAQAPARGRSDAIRRHGLPPP